MKSHFAIVVLLYFDYLCTIKLKPINTFPVMYSIAECLILFMIKWEVCKNV